ncbi:hypothetical protein HF086_000625 [Spodoptera exigua]|uniref:Uncharacterized protein n=1 Tax=Spodoptera exigua TaxID=7107 RepID=A0A922SF80_SPOEX|nr:hypothetical protein HF086_000625 [Spodoptera exigua]
MSSDEEYDNLPNITLFEPSPSCSKDYDDNAKFIIPPVEELVVEREKMRMLKLELQTIDTTELEPRCDLDAELQEAGLIEVQGSLWPAQRPIPTARELWSTMGPYLVQRGVSLDRLPDRLPKLTVALTTDTGDRIIPPADFGWSDSEMLGACVIALVATMARESHVKRVAARTLQTLLDYHASLAQVKDLLDVIVSSFPDARMRRDISDMVINGSRLGADRLASCLCYTALLTIIHNACPDAGIAINKYKKIGECSTAPTSEITDAVKNEIEQSGSAIKIGVIKYCGKNETCEPKDIPIDASVDTDKLEDVVVTIEDLVQGNAYALQRVAEAIPYWRHCTDAERYEVIKLAGRIMADSMSPDATEETVKARKLLLKNLKDTKTQNSSPYHQYKERTEIGKLEMLFSHKY